MMTETLHIISKDLNRLRWLLLLWIGILVVRVTFWSLDISEGDGPAYALLVGQSIIIMGTLQTLMLALLGVRLVQEEPLVGWNAFWFTRPYSRNALMTAKLLFAAAVFIAVPLLADLVTMAIYHAGARAQMESAATFSATYVSWTLLVVALAAMTPTLGAFVMASVAAAVGLTVLAMTIAMVGQFVSRPSGALSIASDPRPYVAAMLVLDAGLLCAIVFQYRHRRWRTAATLAVVAVVASVAVPILWMPRQTVAADAGAWSKDPAASPVVVDRQWRMQIKRRAGEPTRHQVYAAARLQNIPATYVIDFVDVESTLTLPDGTVVRSRQGRRYDDRLLSAVSDGDPRGFRGAQVAALNGVTVVRGANEGNFEYWPALITLSEDQYARLRGHAGRLDATLRFVLNQVKRRVTLPLEPGAAHADGLSRVEFLRAEQEADGFSITIRRWKATSPITPSPFTSAIDFVLQNTSRGEALTPANRIPLPNQQSYGVSSYEGPLRFPVLGSVSVGMNREGFAVRVEKLRYPDRIVRPGETRTFDAAWFAGANLAVLETEPAGIVTRSVTIDDFVIPSG